MDNITIKAPAKINLYLDVIGKRGDGYHDLRMIMQSISLFDDISISKAEMNIEVKCKARYVPQGEKNIAYRAAKLMVQHFGLKEGIRISINKRIPVAAGLAGGSTDAAAVMKGINDLFEIKADNQELAQLGKHVGADVPFCIMGGTAIAQGIGEILTPLKPFSGVDIVLIKPDFGVSTASVFKKFSRHDLNSGPDINILIKSMERRQLKEVGANLFNALEKVTTQEFKIINEIKAVLNENGAEGSLMSGSGPSVFGIFDNESKAREAFKVLKQKFRNTYLVKTC